MNTIEMNTLAVFQGDVALLKAPKGFKIPKDWVEVDANEKGKVLAYGEVTGHAHAFHEHDNVRVFKNPANDNQMLILVEDRPADLLHEEHTGYRIHPGIVWKGPQHEYSYEDEYRVVAD